MFEATELHLSLGSTPILRGASIAIQTKGITGLLGRNGAGKTTFLRACMGLIPVASGSIKFDGVDLLSAPSHLRAKLGIGYMPEDRRLVPQMSVEENILVPAWAIRSKEMAERLPEVYARIPELVELKDRPAASLSGGQQKLAALGRALLVGSRLLLLDEPSEGVAPVLAQRILTILSGLGDEGPPALIAESNGGYLLNLTPSIYQLERGQMSAIEVAT